MSTDRKIIKIFLGSPGDLNEERRIAKQIVEEENKNHAIKRGYQIDLVGWEETISQSGRPQSVINRELDQCEYFVGMIWKRWGTPPGDDSHPYTSGFEEEYKISLEKKREYGYPEISLLFKKPSNELMSDPGEELKRVLQFRSEVTAGRQILYDEFEKVDDFRAKFRAIVGKCLEDNIEKDGKDVGEMGQGLLKRRVETQSNSSGGVEEVVQPLFESSASDFVAEVIGRSNALENVDMVDIARLRLLAISVERDRNDGEILGIHDSNILYEERSRFVFTDPEVVALRNSALFHFSRQSSPLWCWVYYNGGVAGESLVISSMYGHPAQRSNAIDCLRFMEVDLGEIGGGLDRKRVLYINLYHEANSSVQISMLKYLRSFGIESDVEDILALLDGAETNVHNAVVETVSVIILRRSADSALSFVADWPDSNIEDSVLEEIFSSPEGLDAMVLRKCLEHENASVLMRSAEVLLSRGLLSAHEAERLTNSDSVDVRLVAVRGKMAHDPSLSLKEIREIVVNGGIRIPRFDIFNSSDTENSKIFFEEFERKNLENLPQELLIEKSRNEKYVNNKYTMVLYRKYFGQCRDEIVENLEDGFRKVMKEKRGAESVGNGLLDVSNHYREIAVAETLDILCEKGGALDIEVVRRVLDANEISISGSIAKFLGKFGSNEDLKRMRDGVYYQKGGGISAKTVFDFDRVAKAMMSIVKDEVEFVLEEEYPKKLLVAILRIMPKVYFVNLSDESIVELLANRDGDIRKSVSLRCVESLPKYRIQAIYERYFSRAGDRYYDSGFWLDLGISAPQIEAKRIAANCRAEA